LAAAIFAEKLTLIGSRPARLPTDQCRNFQALATEHAHSVACQNSCIVDEVSAAFLHRKHFTHAAM